MSISFNGLIPGEEYTRPELAALWGFEDWHAIGRGVVTPRGQKIIILFVTKEKQETLTQYEDHFEGDRLFWEGETNHAHDNRILNAASTGDAIHLFYRERHHSPFTYFGLITLFDSKPVEDAPTKFAFDTARTEHLAASAARTEQATHGIGDGFDGDEEGKKRYVLHVTYERSLRNRTMAIQIHGTICKCCGFDFNKVYGSDFARDYIEVHHLESITKSTGKVNPAIDLVPLCSNCHSMVHRKRGEIIPIQELRALMLKALDK